MEMTLKLFDLYPDANKTESLTISLVALLERYPLHVVQQLFDPKHGIHTRHTFMPKAAELTAYLLPLEDRLYRQTQAERTKLLAAPIEDDRSTHPTYAELRQKFSPPGTVFGLKLLPNSKHDIASMSVDERNQALESAKSVRAEMVGMKLSDEARGTLIREE